MPSSRSDLLQHNFVCYNLFLLSISNNLFVLRKESRKLVNNAKKLEIPYKLAKHQRLFAQQRNHEQKQWHNLLEKTNCAIYKNHN